MVYEPRSDAFPNAVGIAETHHACLHVQNIAREQRGR
jgi:hypothetical protein